jgi:hypothetical protein
MRYGPDIIKIIVSSLEEVPNIRHVIKKVGIHHSTYYKWFVMYPEFREKVTIALFKGRSSMSDMAEGNIFRGIKEGDKASSRFYLSHNNPRYMTYDKHIHYGRMMKDDLEKSKPGTYPDGELFDEMFPKFLLLEELHGADKAKTYMDALLNVSMGDNDELIDIFYACYEEWKNKTKKEIEDLENLKETLDIKD